MSSICAVVFIFGLMDFIYAKMILLTWNMIGAVQYQEISNQPQPEFMVNEI
jgi:hypothetical protein